VKDKLSFLYQRGGRFSFMPRSIIIAVGGVGVGAEGRVDQEEE
jgi:hypothetical protein